MLTLPGTGRVQYPLEDAERFVEQIRRAGQGDLELLHRFFPAAFTLERLEPLVLFLEDRLLRIEDQVIEGTHALPPLLVQSGAAP